MKLKLLVFLFPLFATAQGYTSYFTGNTTDLNVTAEFGVCLMGGATEHDNAMKWLLQKANGGDVVVLRSSGSDGYNDYLYSELGINVNSVETLVITSVAGATNPYVLDKVSKAEMIWFAGGDQYNYVSYFKDNALEDLINNHVNVKHAPIGGTSAGMAILGGIYFSAQNGSVTSAQALNNPFHPNVTLGSLSDFLKVPFLEDVITDTHYDNPDRKGRHSAFMARIKNQGVQNPRGIACNEYVAVCIGNDGKAYVYGDYPNYDEFAYFIAPNCENIGVAEICQAGTPLTWNYGGKALKVYKVPGTMNGTHYFDLNNWALASGSGGSWEDWSVVNGVLNMTTGVAPNCLLGNPSFAQEDIQVFPNPFQNFITVKSIENASVTIFDSLGRKIYHTNALESQNINTASFSSGLYAVRIEKEGKITTRKMIKE